MQSDLRSTAAKGLRVVTDLDSPALRAQLDPDGSYERNRSLPEQCQEAWEAVRSLSLPDTYMDVRNIIVTGMGGSAIAGDFVQALAFTRSPLPVSVVRGSHLPLWAGPDTLVIACSHSGDTEETLSAFQEALAHGARTVAITTGGRLKELSTECNLPVLTYDYPPEPRAAIGHQLLRLLALLHAVGAMPIDPAEVDAAIASMNRLRRSLDGDVPEKANPAKQLARRLDGRLPYIVGAGYLFPVARRWKSQINENPEAWAIYDEVPELHHNTAVGLSMPSHISSEIYAVILEHSGLSDTLKRRNHVTAELFEHRGIDYERLDLGHGEALEAMLNGTLYANFVSYYLAMLTGVRPMAIDNIDWLKNRLSQL